MSTTELQTEIRDELRNVPKDDFLKAHTRAEMDLMAEEFGLDPSEYQNKGALYDGLVEASDIPDPSLREKSSVSSPVAEMWRFCDAWIGPIVNGPEGHGGRPRRKDVIAKARSEGIAYHTARTQYQSWATATRYGEIRLVDLDRADIPRKVRDELDAGEED